MEIITDVQNVTTKNVLQKLSLSWIMQDTPGSAWVGGLLLREPGVLEYPSMEHQPALGMGMANRRDGMGTLNVE